MNRLPFFRTVAAAALLAVAGVAQAGTVLISGYTYGNGNTVNVTAPAYNGGAGGFSGTMSGYGSFDGHVFDGSFLSYCVDLGQFFSPGVSYVNSFTLVKAADHFTATQATALSRLITHVYRNQLLETAADKDQQSTAVQLAVWNLVYDSDASLDAGSFTDASIYKTGTASFVGANALLAGSQAARLPLDYDLYVLKSASQQDQLVWKARLQVPEPASLALVVLALAGAGVVTRRRSA